MRSGMIAAVFLSLCSGAQAGVYNLGEFHPNLIPRDEARNYILKLRSAASPRIPALEEFKALLLRQAEVLEKEKVEGFFSTLDRVNLAGCYLRLGRAREAERLLVGREQDHFLVQSNLAAAYFLAGELQMAVRHQERALEHWPVVWAGWNDERIWHYRQCEHYLLKLYRAREEEARRGRRGMVDIDSLFPGLRFVGPGGEYEAGTIDPTVRDRLPPDAFGVVFQLCLWFPADQRLYWLLGEMLNAAGAINQAFDIFQELVEGGALFKDLHRHRRVVKEALPAYHAPRRPEAQRMLLAQMLLIPRPTFAPPGIGDVAQVAAAGAGRFVPLRPTNDLVVLPVAPPGSPGDKVEYGLPFNFRHVSVGFGFGFLVAALLGFQWREWRRRRLLPAVGPPGPAGG